MNILILKHRVKINGMDMSPGTYELILPPSVEIEASPIAEPPPQELQCRAVPYMQCNARCQNVKEHIRNLMNAVYEDIPA